MSLLPDRTDRTDRTRKKPKVKIPVPVFTSELIKDPSPTCSLLNNLQREEQVLIQKLYIVRQLADVVKTEISASSLMQDATGTFNNPIIYINYKEQQNPLEYGNSHYTLLPDNSQTNIYPSSSQTNLPDSSTDASSTLLQETSITDCNISNPDLFNSATNLYPSALQETSVINCSDSSANTYPYTFFQETNIINCNTSQPNSSTNTYSSTLSQEISSIDHNTSQPKSSNSSANTCVSGNLFKIETPKTFRAKLKRKSKRRYQNLVIDLEKRSELLENELIERYRNLMLDLEKN
ncbi:4440_t:CDS:2, partial [Dentiscutata erythropus]